MQDLRVETLVLSRQGTAVESTLRRGRVTVPAFTKHYDGPSIDEHVSAFLSDWADFLYETERATMAIGDNLTKCAESYDEADDAVMERVKNLRARWEG